MARIIDTNKHGIRREIDHQYKKGKKNAIPKEIHRKRKESFKAKEIQENKEEEV